MTHHFTASRPCFPGPRAEPLARRPTCRTLWLLFGVTFVSFGFSPFRLSFGAESAPVNLAPPVVLLFAILAVGVAFEPKIRRSSSQMIAIPGSLLFVFLAYHYVSALTASNVLLALRDASKLLVSVMFMWGIARYFPVDGRLLERVWTFVIWVSTVVFAVLIYQSVFVFEAVSLSANLFEETRAMRNQMTWYLVFVFPMALAYSLFRGQVRVVSLVPTVVLAIAWAYAGSRNAWIAVSIGVLSVVPLVVRVVGRKRLFVSAVAVGLFTVAALTTWNLLSNEVAPEASRRLQDLYAPASIQELNSYEVRFNRVRIGVSNFLTAPVFGLGLTNGGEEHNDYIKVLAELGALGILVFGLVVCNVFYRVWPLRRARAIPFLWVSVGTRMVLVGVLVSLAGINGYDSPLVWSFLGLAFALRRIEFNVLPARRLGSPARNRVSGFLTVLGPQRRTT